MNYYLINFNKRIDKIGENVINYGCANSGISEIYFPDTVSSMSENAVYDCVYLQNLKIGNNLYMRQKNENNIRVKIGGSSQFEKIKPIGCTTLPFTLKRSLCCD